jgi:spermidine synthase
MTGDHPSMKNSGAPNSSTFVAILFLFVASGFSSLIYQVVWTRLLTLVFGCTTYATATTLSVFMGGLALGSYLAGRCELRVRRPLLWYGLLEGIIGGWALLVPHLFDAAVPLYQMLWQSFHLSMLPFSLMRFALAAAILIVPTSCMGATLPLLAKFVVSSVEAAGYRIGLLYGSNTLGAVFGAAITGFIFLPDLGMHETTLIAAWINLILCATVMLAAATLERRCLAETAAAEPPAEGETTGTSAATVTVKQRQSAIAKSLSAEERFAVIAFGISGGAAMIQEVAWTRALQMVIGSTIYSFTIMLATFLLGIAVGSFGCSRFINRKANPMLLFAAIQLLIFWATIFALNQFNHLPYWNLIANRQFLNDPSMSMLVRVLLSAALLLPLTVLLGIVFPIMVKISVHQLSSVGRSIGTIYAANTIGAIVGSFIAGFALIPQVGVEKTLMLACTLNLCLSLGACWYIPKDFRPPVRFAVIVCFIVPVLCFACGLTFWARLPILSAQLQRRVLDGYGVPSNYLTWQADINQSLKMLFCKDGASTTVGVVTAGGVRSIITNGHIDGSDNRDMSTQVMLSAIPLMLRRDIKSVAIVGWGTGVTVGSVAEFPVDSIEAIELDPVVLEGSQFFNHVNHRPQTDPRVHLQINDARNYFLASDRKFDLIVSEPSNPWQSGVCQLFTREFFQLCKARLNSGGTCALWVQIVEIPPDVLASIIGSLHDVFPYCLAVRANRENLVIMGSNDPFTIDLSRLREAFANKKVPVEFAGFKVTSAESVLARIAMTPQSIDKLVNTAGRNLDDNNQLEYRVGKTYENKIFVAENSRLLDSFFGQPWDLIVEPNTQPAARAQLMQTVADECLKAELPNSAARWRAAAKMQPAN